MAELRAPEQNRLLGQLANMLRTTEGSIAAPEFLPPQLDVMGLVRQLMLPSAETVEKMSYGDPLFRMPMQSNIPITADREYLADIAGMIPFGAPAARPSARGMQELVRQIQTEPPVGAIRPYNKEEIRRIDEEILSAKVPEGTYFHGTDKAFKDFRKKDRGLAYYFTPDPMQAASYSGMDVGANIRPVKLNIKKTYRGGDVDEIMEVVKKEGDYYPYTVSKMREFLEEQDPKAFHTPSVVKALKKLGYDSFVEYEGGIEQIGVFSAKDVKPSFGAGLLDEPAQSVAEAPKFEMPSFATLRPDTGAVTLGSKADELNALKARLDELNNQFATDTAPPSAVREHGAVMKRYQELQDELYPRPQTTLTVQEPDVPQGLLPEQSVQEISKAVAQRDVVQTDNFKSWFGDWQADPVMASKVVDENGLPKIVFHGTQRPDRIGTQFRKSRATSGPMSFFTDDPEIASGYATGKRDTSLAYEDTDYANWFKRKDGRSRLNLDQVGARMSSQERQEVLDKLRRVGQDDQGNIVIGEPLVSDQTFDFMLRDPREAGGNPLRLANKLWLESGTLYGREEDFSKVLKAIGVKGFEEDFPTSTYPAVYPVYLDIKNPLNTMQIDDATLSALESAASRQRKPRAMGGADQWDKRMRDPQEWISQLKADMAEGKNSMVWTSIPDWVTNTLKKRGFDGIEDVGGKSFGTPHSVWIPFEENQIKSATGNVGTFSSGSKNILKSAAPIVGGGLLGAEMMQEEETY